MPDECLRAKLIDAGYSRADIEITGKEELLNLFADFVVQTQIRSSVSEEETTAMDDNGPQQNSSERDLDREAFEFEKSKWADEMKKWEAEERRKDLELEQRRAELEERKAELEERRAERKLKEAELELKKNEAAKQDTSVGKNKIFSDAMRSSAIRMSNDPIKAIAFFMNVEQLFNVYKVPTDLQAF